MKTITVNKKIFGNKPNKQLLEHLFDIMFSYVEEVTLDVGCVANIGVTPTMLPILASPQKHTQFAIYSIKQRDKDIALFENVFVKLWLFYKIRLVNFDLPEETKTIDTIDELLNILTELKNDISQKTNNIFFILDEIQCAFLFITNNIVDNNDMLECHAYFYDKQHIEFVKNIVQTEGLYLNLT